MENISLCDSFRVDILQDIGKCIKVSVPKTRESTSGYL